MRQRRFPSPFTGACFRSLESKLDMKERFVLALIIHFIKQNHPDIWREFENEARIVMSEVTLSEMLAAHEVAFLVEDNDLSVLDILDEVGCFYP